MAKLTCFVTGVLKLRRRHKASSREKHSKDEEDLIVMQLPGRKGVRIDGCDSVIKWKPLAKVQFWLVYGAHQQ